MRNYVFLMGIGPRGNTNRGGTLGLKVVQLGPRSSNSQKGA